MKNPFLKKLFKTTMYKRFKNERLVKDSKSVYYLPEIGMGATTGAGSDCYPHTIVEVANDLSYVVIQADNHKPAPGYNYFSNQIHILTPNSHGHMEKYTLRKNGRYIREGSPAKHYWQGVSIGHRRYYRDPSF